MTTHTLRKAFIQFIPEIDAKLVAIESALANHEDLTRTLETVYPTLPKISIDYAIMEKARNIILIPSSFDWDDVGSWPALERHFKPDAEGNVTQGKTVTHEATRNIIVGGENHLVGVIGIDNLIIIHTPDATLICPKHKGEQIKQLVQKMEQKGGYTSWL